MAQAAEALFQTQQEQAEEHQAAAEAALEQAQQAFEHALAEQEQGQPEQGQPEQGQPEQGQPEQGQPEMAMPTQQPTPQQGPTLQPEDQERALGEKTDPAGRNVARANAKWNPLGDRKREQLFQIYARELPIEYRELLENYYETLSKDASSKRRPGTRR